MRTLSYGIALLSLVLAACESSYQEDTGASALPKREMSTSEKIQSQKWCFVEPTHSDYMLMARVSFDEVEPDAVNLKSQVDYFQVEEGKAPVLFKGALKMDWVVNNSDVETGLPPVTLIEDQEQFIYQTVFESQSEYYGDLKSNKNIPTSGESFNPQSSLIIKKATIPYMGRPGDRMAFPCKDFSGAFLRETGDQPLFQLGLFMAQKHWQRDHHSTSLSAKNREMFERNMPIEFPVTLNQVGERYFSGTEWCAWRGTEDGESKVTILTIGDEKMVKSNLYSYQEFNKHSIVNRLGRGRIRYIHSSKNGQIEDSDRETEGLKGLYYYITDNSGARMLIPGSYYNPGYNLPYFDQIFFSCDDERALELVRPRKFKRTLKRYIRAQHQYFGTQ